MKTIVQGAKNGLDYCFGPQHNIFSTGYGGNAMAYTGYEVCFLYW